MNTMPDWVTRTKRLRSDGRWEVLNAEGRVVSECKTEAAADRVIRQRLLEAERNEQRIRERAAQDMVEEDVAWEKYNALAPRLRKVVSREPGFAVNRLGERCESVLDYWGAPVRTVIVVMAEGASLEHTAPLTTDDHGAVQGRLGCYG